ncbi:hypothetical protein REH81_19630 [Vibrio rotiferianus]
MDNETFYFLAYPGGDHKKITVIDLGFSVEYQRNDWANVNDETYYDHEKAITDARKLADKFGLEYVPFDSRYNSDLSEPKHPQLTLDEEE